MKIFELLKQIVIVGYKTALAIILLIAVCIVLAILREYAEFLYELF